MVGPFKKIIQLELNEVSTELINANIANGNLPNFRKITKEWDGAPTVGESKYEKIEPWIQWVTVHTGKTYEEHQVFRLGDICNYQGDQIWEVLSDNQMESAIIGCMNAKRGRAKGGVFFPDPWSKLGDVYPEKLMPLWKFISSRVQSHSIDQMPISNLSQVLHSFLNVNVPGSLILKIARQIIIQKIDSHQKWKLASIFDEYLFALFENILKDTNFKFNAIFLNSLAHYQHHFWRLHEPNIFNPSIHSPDCRLQDDPIGYGLKIYDRILGKILDKYSQDSSTLVVIITGLSQVPYLAAESRGGMHYYRLKSHAEFLKALGCSDIKIFPMMSRDWQISSDSLELLKIAYAKLADLKVNGSPLFNIKANSHNSFFIETAIEDGDCYDQVITNNNGNVLGKISDWFVSIAVKSGCHKGEGYIWTSQRDQIMKNKIRAMPLQSVYKLGLNALGLNEI